MPLFGPETPEAVTVNGVPLSCVICKHDAFFERRAQLHGPVATLFNLEWTAPHRDLRHLQPMRLRALIPAVVIQPKKSSVE